MSQDITRLGPTRVSKLNECIRIRAGFIDRSLVSDKTFAQPASWITKRHHLALLAYIHTKLAFGIRNHVS